MHRSGGDPEACGGQCCPGLQFPLGMAVPNTWIADLRDFLDGAGGLAELPGPVRRLADHFGAIVAAISSMPPEQVVEIHVRYRRRPLRRPCGGTIHAIVDADARIRWACSSCEDNGVISGWRGTPWDMRRAGGRH